MRIADDRYDLILSSMRILTLLEAFKSTKSYIMTFDKLVLLDFYMRFPKTMVGHNRGFNEYDFEELYSFYHSHPDRESYRKVINFLISKKLINQKIIGASFVYQIDTSGIEIIKSISNPYSLRMMENASLIKKDISSLPESKIIEDINSKSLNNMKFI